MQHKVTDVVYRSQKKLTNCKLCQTLKLPHIQSTDVRVCHLQQKMFVLATKYFLTSTSTSTSTSTGGPSTSTQYNKTAYWEETLALLDQFQNYRQILDNRPNFTLLRSLKKWMPFSCLHLWPPDQGLCPWTPLGALPQTPIIGLRKALDIAPSKLNWCMRPCSESRLFDDNTQLHVILTARCSWMYV